MFGAGARKRKVTGRSPGEEMELRMEQKERSVFMAKLAEQAERYEDMAESMKQVARMDIELNAEERNLFSVGYKHVIGAKRSSWRVVYDIEQKEEAKGTEHNLNKIRECRKQIEHEISSICNEILSIVAIHLLPSSNTSESFVFFYKMKGDYYRYLAELKSGNERQVAADESLRAYQVATGSAMTDLAPANPIRLGLALNFSVFYHEIMGSIERAFDLARQAFDEAMTEINTHKEESYSDSMQIMRLITDNLSLWATTNDSEVVYGSNQESSAGIT